MPPLRPNNQGEKSAPSGLARCSASCDDLDRISFVEADSLGDCFGGYRLPERFIGLLGVFDRIHLLTLVFGASLIGGAQDYGTYFYATDSPRMRVNLTHGNYCVGSRRR